MRLIVNRSEAFWPPREAMIQPHPVYVTLARNLLIAALYNYDQLRLGRSEDMVSWLDMSEKDRAHYAEQIKAWTEGQ